MRRPALPPALASILASACLFLLAGLPQEHEGLTATPLPKRSPRGEATLFERLSPETTGIDFEHRWSDDPADLHVLGNAMAGGGVALGDANGDGQSDVLLTRAAGGQRLYLNQGGFRFVDGTDSAGMTDESWGNGASFGDVNGDGSLDLYVCGYGRPNRLWMNAGDGTFEERAAQAGVAFLGASVMMSFADYDNDGDLDGYLLTNRFASQEMPSEPVPYVDGRVAVPDDLLEQFDVLATPDGSTMMIIAGQYDHLYRNDGDGNFTDVSELAGISGNHMGLSASWWDSDGDGLTDLYVANDFFGPDKLYRNQGDGTFTDIASEVLPHTPWFSMGSDAADVNNDGLLDLIASDMLPTERYRRHVAMGELANALWFPESSDPPQYMRNALFVNSGAGRFLEAAWIAGLAASDWTWSTVFADLDEDGRVDLFVSNGMTRDFFNSDRRNESQRHPIESMMADFWVPLEPLREPNLAFRNVGELDFRSVGPDWGLDHLGVSFGAALADLDGDGDVDIVTNDFEAPAGVYRNRAAEGHRVSVRLVGRSSNTQGLGARVTIETATGSQMRFVTLAHGFMAAGNGTVQFGTGDESRIERLVVEWPSGQRQELTDLAADQAFVLTEPDGKIEPVSEPGPTPRFVRREGLFIVDPPYNDFAVQPLLPFRMSRLGPGLAVGDVDDDGDQDFVVGGARGRPALLMTNEGDGGFAVKPQAVFERDASQEDMAPLLFDADGDGDLDLYMVSGSIESRAGSRNLGDRLYVNDGAGKFSQAPRNALPPVRDSGGVVAAADVDRDGDLDLFVGGRVVPGAWPTVPGSHLLRNDGGTFSDVTTEVAAGLDSAGRITSALWTDVDDDGWIDLLLTREFDSVALWRNDGTGKLLDATEAAGLSARRGLWNSVAGRDLDGDGDMDYVVTNLGLNTRYRDTSDKNPWVVLYGEYDGGGLDRVLEIEIEHDSFHLLRCRTCIIRGIPMLSGFHPTHESWAYAVLSDIASTQAIQAALQVSATSLASGVLLNDGQGVFDFRELPRVAQLAPGYGVVLTEVDGDGVADLYVVGNSHAPHGELGRFDGGIGWLLRGLGDGSFEPVPPAESGLVVGGDAKSLVATDFDGDGRVDFIVGVNNGPFLLFYQDGDEAPANLTVRLRFPGANPTAVGARVTVTLPDGSTQTAEVSAGGGYLSQSSSTLVFGLGEADRVASVSVRWPDGRSERFEPGPDERQLTFGER